MTPPKMKLFSCLLKFHVIGFYYNELYRETLFFYVRINNRLKIYDIEVIIRNFNSSKLKTTLHKFSFKKK